MKAELIGTYSGYGNYGVQFVGEGYLYKFNFHGQKLNFVDITMISPGIYAPIYKYSEYGWLGSKPDSMDLYEELLKIAHKVKEDLIAMEEKYK